MNKSLLFALLSAMCLTSFADDTASDLIFKFQDGSVQSIDAKNLEMKIKDEAIEANNGSMTLNIPLSTLQQFYFSESSGIGTIIQNNLCWTLYNLQGKEVGTFSNLSLCQGQLASGIYIAKCPTATIKIAIK